MGSEITAYPLCWPPGWKRTQGNKRLGGRFNKKQWHPSSSGTGGYHRSTYLTVADAVERVIQSLDKLGVERGDMIVSTNIVVKLNGLPYSGQKEPADPGAAVYWRKREDKQMKCMAIDQYTTVADNIAAVAATIEAMRAIERHGGAEILERAFLGFQALPVPGSEEWRNVLREPKDLDEAEATYRSLAKQCHPDHGGDVEQFTKLGQAIEQARVVLGGA